MLILQSMDQFPKYKQKMPAKQSHSDVDVQAFITDFQNKWYFNVMLLFFYCITVCKYSQYSATLGKVEIFIFSSKQLKVTHNLFFIHTLNWIFSKCTF